MTPEFAVSLSILTALIVLICMVGYLIHVLSPAKPARSKSSGTIHPGMSDDHFMAIMGAVANHYRINNDELVAILTAAAAHALGMPVSVVKFKPLDTMDWTWAVQGRVALHSHKA
jgi:hypothetical protein